MTSFTICGTFSLTDISLGRSTCSWSRFAVRNRSDGLPTIVCVIKSTRGICIKVSDSCLIYIITYMYVCIYQSMSIYYTDIWFTDSRLLLVHTCDRDQVDRNASPQLRLIAGKCWISTFLFYTWTVQYISGLYLSYRVPHCKLMNWELAITCVSVLVTKKGLLNCDVIMCDRWSISSAVTYLLLYIVHGRRHRRRYRVVHTHIYS